MKKFLSAIFICFALFLFFFLYPSSASAQLDMLNYSFPPDSLVCTPDLVGDRDSRPYYNIPIERACDLCNLTGLFCPSCATSLTVHYTVDYRRGDGTPEPPHCVETSWGGTVTIDPTETKIPFVGKKGEESEEKYLADYFEGTSEYYEDYPMYWRDWINYAGVWRKLSPMEYQNQLKEKMVERAEETIEQNIHEGGVHNYRLEYKGRLCWDFPFLGEVFLAIARRVGLSQIPGIGHIIDFIYKRTNYCIFEGEFPGVSATKWVIDTFNGLSPVDISIKMHTTDENATLTALDGHFPPDPDEEDYAEKWNAWKESKWGKLWVVVPMFSHEDTPGQIAPYLGYKSKDEPQSISSEVEKVPHVARLYEATQEVQNMLVPSYQEDLQFTQNKTEPTIELSEVSQPTIASPGEENVLGEKILLAQDPMVDEPLVCGISGPMPVPECEQEAITDFNENDELCCDLISIGLHAVDAFENPGYEKCREEGITCRPPGCTPGEPGCICYDPCNEIVEQSVNRRFGINLLHPYLTDIWYQTGLAETAGLFNIFRPEDEKTPKFREIDASSEIVYTQSGFDAIEPSIGKFYFNYLGGVQLAKEWVTRALRPWKE